MFSLNLDPNTRDKVESVMAVVLFVVGMVLINLGVTSAFLVETTESTELNKTTVKKITEDENGKKTTVEVTVNSNSNKVPKKKLKTTLMELGLIDDEEKSNIKMTDIKGIDGENIYEAYPFPKSIGGDVTDETDENVIVEDWSLDVGPSYEERVKEKGKNYPYDLNDFSYVTDRRNNSLTEEDIKTILQYSTYDLDGEFINPHIMVSMFYTESSLRPNVKNDGCYGLGQVKLGTARMVNNIYSIDQNITKETLMNKENNIKYSVLYMNYLYKKYNGNYFKMIKVYSGSKSSLTRDRYINKLNQFLYISKGISFGRLATESKKKINNFNGKYYTIEKPLIE